MPTIIRVVSRCSKNRTINLSDQPNMLGMTGALSSTINGHQLLSNLEALSPTPRPNTTEPAPTTSDRNSGAYLSDTDDLRASSRPTSLSSTCTLSKVSISQHNDAIARLQRPVELNLGFHTTIDSQKPRSELDLRYDLIRNSQNQNKAALRSPTQLLNDRLNFSSKKVEITEKVRIFTPPKPTLNGCILPGPAFQMGAFVGLSVRARISKSNRPAWWCKLDKVVVFDGVEGSETGGFSFKTRSSKGLSVARKRGDFETIVIPLECLHCQEMLNRSEWKYDVQICRRGVCWDCKERCRWEMGQEVMVMNDEKLNGVRADANRLRADSVLQDDEELEDKLPTKLDIEQRLKTPTKKAGGIDERVGNHTSLTSAIEAKRKNDATEPLGKA